MFKRRGAPETMTTAEKIRAVKMNRIMTVGIAVLLLYWLYQSYREPEPMPVWFIISMAVLIALCVAIFFRNLKLEKELEGKHRQEIEDREKETDESTQGEVPLIEAQPDDELTEMEVSPSEAQPDDEPE